MEVEEAELRAVLDNGEVGEHGFPGNQRQAPQPLDNRAEMEMLRRSLVRAEQDAANSRARLEHLAAQFEQLQQLNAQHAPQEPHPAPGVQGQPPAAAHAEGKFFYDP